MWGIASQKIPCGYCKRFGRESCWTITISTDITLILWHTSSKCIFWYAIDMRGRSSVFNKGLVKPNGSRHMIYHIYARAFGHDETTLKDLFWSWCYCWPNKMCLSCSFFWLATTASVGDWVSTIVTGSLESTLFFASLVTLLLLSKMEHFVNVLCYQRQIRPSLPTVYIRTKAQWAFI